MKCHLCAELDWRLDGVVLIFFNKIIFTNHVCNVRTLLTSILHTQMQQEKTKETKREQKKKKGAKKIKNKPISFR